MPERPDPGYLTGGKLALDAARELVDAGDLLGAALHARMAADQFVLVMWRRDRAQWARDRELAAALARVDEGVTSIEGGTVVKKIPTLFERDWDGDRSRVTEQVTPGCEWVIAGEGIATRKLDGTCCLVRDGQLYRRHQIREGAVTPAGFEAVEVDPETGKVHGWVPVGFGPEDRWHREAWDTTPDELRRDGTYELIGPKVRGNPERSDVHVLVPHTVTALQCADPPRNFAGLAEWLASADLEGVVWHHPDGRMAKIKARDFGIKRDAGDAGTPAPASG